MVDRQLDIDGLWQFPPRDPSAKRLFEERASRTDDARSVETTEGRAPRDFRRHSGEHIPRWAGGHQRLKVFSALDEVVSNVARVWRRCFGKHLDHGVDHEFLFGWPPPIDCGFPNPRVRRDRFNAHRLRALLDEERERGASDGLVGRRAPRAPRPACAGPLRRWGWSFRPRHGGNQISIRYRSVLI